MSLTVVVLAFISTGNGNTVLTKLFAEIREYGDTAQKKSDGARNTNSQTIRQISKTSAS